MRIVWAICVFVVALLSAKVAVAKDDDVGLTHADLGAMRALNDLWLRDISSTGQRLLRDKAVVLVVVRPTGHWLWRSLAGYGLRQELGLKRDRLKLLEILNDSFFKEALQQWAYLNVGQVRDPDSLGPFLVAARRRGERGLVQEIERVLVAQTIDRQRGYFQQGRFASAFQAAFPRLAKSLTSTLAMEMEALRTATEDARKRSALYAELMKKLKVLIDSSKIRVVSGRGSFAIRINGNAVFRSQSDTVTPSGKQLLADVGTLLSNIPTARFQISAHTDNTVPKKFKSNWELSASRSVKVAKLIIDSGVSANRIYAAAFGDTSPLSDNQTPEARAQNYRIEIVPIAIASAPK